MSIRLHIDQLILEGVNLDQAGERDLRAALEDRLVELFAEHSPTRLNASHLADWHPNPIALSNGMTGNALGTSAAEGIHAGLVHTQASGRARA